MRYLLAFLKRNRIFLLFLFLQALALTLTFNSRSYQRASFYNSSSKVAGNLLNTYQEYSLYLDLDEQNDRLSQENARLRSLVKGSYLPIYSTYNTVEDTVYSIRYQYTSARILNSSYLKTRNFITLDRGKKHGVEPDMGVIGPDGAVGVIKDVSEHFSIALPIINPDMPISGTLKESGHYGPISWNSKDYRFVTLSDIPRQEIIQPGDSVITYGKSLIYPPGILIGTVESYKMQQDQNFYSVNVRLSSDFSSLQHVYIVKDKMKIELKTLEAKNIQDQ